MMLTRQRRRKDKPAPTPSEAARHDLNNATGWLYVAIQEKMGEFISASPADTLTVANCIDYLGDMARVLALVNKELREG